MTTNGSKLTVTTQNGVGTNYSAIDWKTFSIPTGSQTRIDQPNAASFSINRVVTNAPTEIYGTLSSNGRVVLVNQAGIAVSAGALVDTAGFTASALAMSDQDVLAGRLRFGGAGVAPAVGALQVQGNIIARGGDVVLVAPNIDMAKSAVVESSGGSVLLAAGQSVEVTGRGLEGISMQVQAPTDSALNLGTLKGDAVGVFAGTLKHSGLIQAVSANLDGGRVLLKASGDAYVEGSGAVSANSATGQGGRIEVLGKRVALLGNATLDASGATGGGTVLVGGDYQGANAAVQNADITYVGVDTVLNANATGSGNGGRVVVWSDDTTRMYGDANARGGAQGGNGGFIEASGKKYLDFQGLTDTRAPLGVAGTLLLDPDTITIDNSTTNLAGGTFNVSTSTIFAGATANPTLTWATINAQSGIVDIQSSPGASTGSGDINITASGAVTGPTTLSLLANRAINVSPGVVVSGGSVDLLLLAGWTSGLSVTASAGNDINLGAGSSINTTGDVWLKAGGLINGNSGTIAAGSLSVSNVGGGGVQLNGVNTVSTFAADVSSGSGGLQFKNGQVFSVGPAAFVTGIGANDNTNPISLTSTAGGITLNSGISSASLGGGAVTITSADGIYLNSPITTTFNATPAGPVKLVAGTSGITGNPGSVITASGLEVISAGPVDLTGASNAATTIAAQVTGGGFKYAGGGSFAVGTVGGTSGITTSNAVVEVTAGDAFDISKPINAGTARVTLENTSTSTAAPMTQSATGVITGGQLEVLVPDTTGPVNLLLANLVGTVAIDAKGQINFKNAKPSGLIIGTVGTTTGITSAQEGIDIDQTCGCTVIITQPVETLTGAKLVTINAGSGALLTTGAGAVIADQISLQVLAGPNPGAIGGPGTPFVTEFPSGFGTMNIGAVNGAVAGLYLSHTGSLNFSGSNLNVATNAAVTVTTTNSLSVTAVDTGNSDLWLESTSSTVGSPSSGSLKGKNISLLSSSGIDINNDVVATGNLYFGVSSIGDVTQNSDGSGTIKVAGTTTYSGALGNSVNLQGTGGSQTNEFTGVVTIPATGGVVNVENEGNLVVGNMAGSSITLSSATGSITQAAGTITTSNLTANAHTGIVLGAANSVDAFTASNTTTGNVELKSNVPLTVLSAFNGAGNVLIKTSGDLTLSGAVTSVNGTGNAVVLAAGGNVADFGSGVSVPGGARWLVYSTNPSSNSIYPGGPLDTGSMFQQYGATYGVTTVLGSGSGLLYSTSPSAGAVASLIGSVSKVYDGTTTAPLSVANYSVSPVTAPVWGGASTSVVVDVAGIGAFSDPNVGTGKTVSSTGGTAYALFPSSKTVYGIPLASTSGNIGNITGLSLILGSLTGSVTKVYDGNDSAVLQASNYALTGFIGSDGATVGNVVGTYSSKNVGSGLVVTANLLPSDFTPIGSTNFANYTLPTVVSGSVGTITPKPLVVGGINTANKVYDGTTGASLSGGVLSGVVAGDLVSIGSLAGSFVDKGVGASKRVTVSTVALTGVDAQNYSASTIALTSAADITPKPLVVGSISTANKVYDGTTGASLSGGVLSGVVAGDLVSIGSLAGSFVDKGVGSGKPVTVSTVALLGADANNYSVDQASVTTSADITAKLVNVVTLVADNKVYDGNLLATFSGNRLADAVVGDEIVAEATSATFSDKNAGLGKAVTLSGLQLTGADARNYRLSQPNVVLQANITPKPILVSDLTGVNKSYDGTTVARANLSTAMLSGKLPGDEVALASISGAFDNKNVGLDKVVLFESVTLNGVDAPNYKAILVQQQATANIVARELSQWLGVSGGLWSDPANWDAIPDGNNVLAVNVPAGRGAVIVDASAGAINLQSLTSSSGFVITGGSLQVANNFTSNSYVQSGGSVSGAGAFNVSGSFDQTAGNLSFGTVSVAHNSGDLNFSNINAPTVLLTATSGAIRETGALVATGKVTAVASGGIFLNSPNNRIASFQASVTGPGNIELTNVGVLDVAGIRTTAGSILVNNTGGISTSGPVVARGGRVVGVANSPLTIGPDGVSADGDIVLTATNLTSAGNITLNGPIESISGGVALSAASNLTQNASILAPLGVSASAGGTMTFGPLATSGYQPVSYSVNNQPVTPPRPPASNNVATDLVVSLMQTAPDLVADPVVNPIDSLLKQDKERDLSKEPIVSEGQICRP